MTRSARLDSGLHPLLGSIALIAVFAAFAGCAAMRHGWSLSSYQGQLLRVASSGGATALEIERDVDPTLRNYISDKGLPDYIFVESDDEVYLIYVERDEIAIFYRESYPVSAVAQQKPINQEALVALEEEDQKRILEARAADLSSRLGWAEVREEPLTLADVIQRCLAASLTGQSCDVVYDDGIPTIVFRFEEELADVPPALPGVAQEYCLAANRANRLAIVTMVDESRAISFACELGRWGDWVPVKREELEL